MKTDLKKEIERSMSKPFEKNTANIKWEFI